ncbi:Zn-dependent protease [Pelomyxa schiedti]|nr:Zn-dependent protease [Pelomyxa schiedti]
MSSSTSGCAEEEDIVQRAMDRSGILQEHVCRYPHRDQSIGCRVTLNKTLKQFVDNKLKAVPHETHKVIYIQPIGEFPPEISPDLTFLASYVEAFFLGTTVCILSVVPVTEELHFTSRIFITEQLQFLTTPILNWLVSPSAKKVRDPRKELVIIGITMTDLYPRDDWNFVYGIARAKDGVGLYSFARMDPHFDTPTHSSEYTIHEKQLYNVRCAKILSHELGHLFGMKHCIYYHCLMNGSNHQDEMDGAPLHLCAVCLMKLWYTLQFNTTLRYQSLHTCLMMLSSTASTSTTTATTTTTTTATSSSAPATTDLDYLRHSIDWLHGQFP